MGKVIFGFNDLLTQNPELAAEWHPTKNGELTPDCVALYSSKKIWWLRKCGHEWKASIYARSSGNGCPFCSGQRTLEGFNDLTTMNSNLTPKWHLTKNGDLTPEMVTAGSTKKVWWQCSKGHEWQATVSDRNRGRGCPYCSGKRVLKGFNDLVTQNPELALDWHPNKNADLKPDMVTAGSSKKVWWKCAKGHEWQARIADRNNGSDCPYCSERSVLQGFNDLATINPQLAKEWHPTKNDSLTPDMVTANSRKKVWWRGKCGHEWQSVIGSRSKGSGCPYCSGQKVLKCFNDLATINPELSKEWHITKNGVLFPDMVTVFSNQKVWWKCAKGHEWQAIIANRSKGRGCPYCRKMKKVIRRVSKDVPADLTADSIHLTPIYDSGNLNMFYAK